MRSTHVLVSGAGIAGATAAHWLARHGFAVTVVERAPRPRPGGQAVDVRGPAREVAARMGVLDALRDARTGTRGVSFVDDDGAEVWSTTDATLTGGPTGSDDVEILRDDLAAILLDTVPGDVEIRWDDRITALRRDDDGVGVELARGGTRRFDVVLGADGVHSAVRRLAFGPDGGTGGTGAAADGGRVRPLDSHVAVFGAPNEFGLDRWQTFHQTPNTLAGIYSVRDDREVRVMLGFGRPGMVGRDPEEQRRLVTGAFAGAGWHLPRLLELMHSAPDFHFDSMCQVRMPQWSTGRVGLVGDAGYCASPVSGQGTTLAMVGAYVVAGELAADPSDPAAALRRATARMRGWVRANQDLALDAAERTRAAVAGADTMSEVDTQWTASAAAAFALPDYAVPTHR